VLKLKKIILTYLVPALFPFYIQGVLKLKNNSSTKSLRVKEMVIDFNLFGAGKEVQHKFSTS